MIQNSKTTIYSNFSLFFRKRKLANLTSILFFLLCLFIGWNAFHLSQQLEIMKGRGLLDSLKISDLSSQLELAQIELVKIRKDTDVAIENSRLEDEIKIKSFAYQALICEQVRKKLKL